MKSKVVVMCAITWLSVSAIYAQNRDKSRYHNFGTERIWNIQLLAGPIAALSNVDGNLAYDFGFTGGFVYKKKFIATLYGQKMASHPVRTNLSIGDYPAGTEGEISMIHVGGIGGYIFKPESLLHWGVSGSAGVGKLELSVKEPVASGSGITYTDRIFLVIPRLFAELNVTKWFKVNVTGGYRFPGKLNTFYTDKSGNQVQVFKNSDLTKPEFSVSLLFGTYGFRTRSLL